MTLLTRDTTAALKHGASGDNVKAIQEDLKQLGYYSGLIDAQFGPATEKAVKDFQTDYTLQTDGIAGAVTKAKLEKVKSSTAALRMGLSNQEVKTLQRQLKMLGLFSERITGLFANHTNSSVRTFQEKNGLAIDGIAGTVTKSAIKKLLLGGHASRVTQTEPTPSSQVAVPSPANNSSVNTIITAGQLQEMGWTNITDSMVKDLNNTLQRFQINTPERIRHFISQCSHESGAGRYTKEIADGKKYEYRKNLGNVKPGDGPKYKGAGYIQITGRSNYQKFADEMEDPRIMEGVDYVASHYPWASAGFWWQMNKMNQLIDSGASVAKVTRAVNGPNLLGLAERESYYRRSAGIFV